MEGMLAAVQYEYLAIGWGMMCPAAAAGVWACSRVAIVLAVGQNGWVGTGEIWGGGQC